MDRLFSLLADGRAASVMREVKIKRNRGKVISAVLMSHTINVSPNVSGRAWEHSRRSGRRCAAVWIKKMKILSCGCMTRQTARIRVSSHRYTKWIRRIYCHAVLGSAGSNDHLFISNLAGVPCAPLFCEKDSRGDGKCQEADKIFSRKH